MKIIPRRFTATLALLTAGCLVDAGLAQDHGQGVGTVGELTNEMITQVDPCAGSPNEAVCRCALEFPPVTYDTAVTFDLNLDQDQGGYALPTGRTLMNLVRANVVAIKGESPDKQPVRLYINPPATPNAGPQLEQLVHTNPTFADLKLVQALYLPRHLGGEADRLFGSIWWHAKSASMVIAFRGTQTPFEFHLDTLVSSQRTIRCPESQKELEVADGFGIGYLMMRDAIFASIAPYKSEMKRLFVTGHSLGGAIAAIATADLSCQGHAPVIGITFGQPRVFAPGSSHLVDEMQAGGSMVLWRVVNASDPVPGVPPAAVSGNGVKFKHTSASVIYLDDPSAQPGKGAAWNHHFYYDGYFENDHTDEHGVVNR